MQRLHCLLLGHIHMYTYSLKRPCPTRMCSLCIYVYNICIYIHMYTYSLNSQCPVRMCSLCIYVHNICTYIGYMYIIYIRQCPTRMCSLCSVCTVYYWDSNYYWDNVLYTLQKTCPIRMCSLSIQVYNIYTCIGTMFFILSRKHALLECVLYVHWTTSSSS